MEISKCLELVLFMTHGCREFRHRRFTIQKLHRNFPKRNYIGIWIIYTLGGTVVVTALFMVRENDWFPKINKSHLFKKN
jgi:hypothetical protein